MVSEPLAALRDFRDALRNPIPDVDSFVFLISSTFQALHLHPTSIAEDGTPAGTLKAINRFLPGIQVQLLSTAIPTFSSSLDDAQRGLLDALFVPLRDSTANTLSLRPSIASISYTTLTAILSTSISPNTPLPQQSRSFVITTLETLARMYSIDELYWSVWSSSLHLEDGVEKKADGAKELRWEEAVKAAISVPAKVVNAVGRWKSEGWSDDVPHALVPRYGNDLMYTRYADTD